MQHPEPPPAPEIPEQKATERWRALRASAVGLQFGISIVLGALGGKWLDTQLGTEPKLLLLGLLLGAAAGFRELVLLARGPTKRG